MNGQTVLTKATKYAAIAVTAGGNNKDRKELRDMMKKITALFTSQAETLAALSVKTHSGGGGGKNTEMNKTQPVFHVCAHCKREFYHKDRNLLELKYNKYKRYTGWTRVLE